MLAKIVLVLLTIAAAPLFATTDIYACGTYNGTADHHFVVHGPITGSSDCLTITNISGADMELECGGTMITANNGKPLVLSYISANIYMHECKVDSAGYSATFDHVATGANGWYFGWANDFYSTDLDFIYSGTIYSHTEYVWYGQYSVNQCAGMSMIYMVSDNSYPGQNFGANVDVQDTPNASITYSSLYGGQGSVNQSVNYPGGNTDDGISFLCTHANSNPCAGPTVNHVDTYDHYDDGIEFSGPWSTGTIQYNNIYRPFEVGIGCYGHFHCSLDNFTIDSNTVTGGPYHSSSSQPLIAFQGDGSSTSFFTNNSITNNSLTYYPGVSGGITTIGYIYPEVWSTVSGNTISNNNFGASSPLYIQSTAGYTGSGNTCASVTPSGSVTCP